MNPRPENIYLLTLLMIITGAGISLVLIRRKRKNKKYKPAPAESLTERKKIYFALILPCFFLFAMWFVKFTEISLRADFSDLGILPRELKGLPGIISAPLIHDDFRHLIDNSIPFFLLCLAVFYFYREIAYRIFIIIYLSTGFLVWLIGRDAFHIGASGLIYAFASFLFFSGIIRQNVHLLAISLLVIFLYGGMIWGILPYDYKISWESHLMGGVTGFILALINRDKGPERKKYSWEYEEEDDDESSEFTEDENNAQYFNHLPHLK